MSYLKDLREIENPTNSFFYQQLISLDRSLDHRTPWILICDCAALRCGQTLIKIFSVLASRSITITWEDCDFDPLHLQAGGLNRVSAKSLILNGGRARTRTVDLLRVKQAL